LPGQQPSRIGDDGEKLSAVRHQPTLVEILYAALAIRKIMTFCPTFFESNFARRKSRESWMDDRYR